MFETGFGRALACAAGVLIASLGTGCNGDKPTGTVSGTVRYKGAPVAGGDVNFLGKNGAAAVGKVDASGAFKIDEALETDEYRVYLSSPPPEPVAPGTRVAKPKSTDVPKKFKDPMSSGVVVSVKVGKNEVPVEFKD